MCLRGFFTGPDKEGGDDGSNRGGGRKNHGQGNTAVRKAGRNRKRNSRDDRTQVGFVKVSAHTHDVADVVPDVIRDDRGVPRVIFRNADFYFTDQVRANVRAFSEDSAAHPGKERLSAGAHSGTEQSGADFAYRLNFGPESVVPL